MNTIKQFTRVFAACSTILLACNTQVFAEEFDNGRQARPMAMDHSQHDTNPNATPPTMSHHGHTGMWMFEYRFMRMFMNGMLDGSSNIDPQTTLLNPSYTKDRTYYSSADSSCPSTANTAQTGIIGQSCTMTNAGNTMSMDMHMLMGMYQQTSRLSWMVMLNYVRNTMSMYDKMDQFTPANTFNMNSAGLGDTQLFMKYKLTKTDLFDVSYTLGLNLPSGSIDASDGITSSTTGQQGIAPYTMQLGSGTYDIISALTLEKDQMGLDYGAQIYRVSRTGKNAQYYNRGDLLKFWGWARYRLNVGTQIRTAVIQQFWAPVEGRDERMSDNTRYTGGKRLDVSLGVGQNIKDFRVYLDYAYPLLQRLNGVQMKTTGTLTLGLQYMYM